MTCAYLNKFIFPFLYYICTIMKKGLGASHKTWGILSILHTTGSAYAKYQL